MSTFVATNGKITISFTVKSDSCFGLQTGNLSRVKECKKCNKFKSAIGGMWVSGSMPQTNSSQQTPKCNCKSSSTANKARVIILPDEQVSNANRKKKYKIGDDIMRSAKVVYNID